jgi:hypothetical protein
MSGVEPERIWVRACPDCGSVRGHRGRCLDDPPGLRAMPVERPYVPAAAYDELKKKGSPGVMHEVDRAFYELAIKERDYERVRADRLQRERDAARAATNQQEGPS